MESTILTETALKQGASRMLELFSMGKNDELTIIHEPEYNYVALALESIAKERNIPITNIPIKNTEKESLEKIRESYQTAKNIILLTKLSITHHEYMRIAESNKAKVLSVVNLSKDTMQRAGSFDYSTIETINAVIGCMLDNTNEVIIENHGMKFRLKKEKRIVKLENAYIPKGRHSNFPIGEVCVAPIETSGDGVLKLDRVSIPEDGNIVFLDNVIFKIQNGKIACALSENAKKAAAYLRRFENWNILAELGIGTNPWTLFDSSISESEKCLGTVHIAFGENRSFGGITESQSHKDGVLRKPTVFFDNKKIIDSGSILIDEIKRMRLQKHK